MVKNICKILVCYHKPSKLFESEFFVPINAGRALLDEKIKNNELSPSDKEWLLNNTIGDNYGDNISILNKSFCELTAVYWAWKNYEKLGNPNYIGLCHYRRLIDFSEESLESLLESNYDIVAVRPEKEIIKNFEHLTIKDQFIKFHKEKDLNFCLDCINASYPQFCNLINEYFENNFSNGFFYNMFVVKKDIFFEYCSFIFDILLKLHNSINYSEYSAYGSRVVGFIGERLTGAFFNYKKTKGCKLLPLNHIFYSENDIKILKNNIPAHYKNVVLKSVECISVIETKYFDLSNIINFVVPFELNKIHLFENTVDSIITNLPIDKNYCFSFILYNEINLYKFIFYIRTILKKYIDINLTYSVRLCNLIFNINNNSIEASGSFFQFYSSLKQLFNKNELIYWVNSGVVFNKNINSLFQLNSNKFAACKSIYFKSKQISFDKKNESDYDFSLLKNYFQTNLIIFRNTELNCEIFNNIIYFNGFSYFEDNDNVISEIPYLFCYEKFHVNNLNKKLSLYDFELYQKSKDYFGSVNLHELIGMDLYNESVNVPSFISAYNLAFLKINKISESLYNIIQIKSLYDGHFNFLNKKCDGFVEHLGYLNKRCDGFVEHFGHLNKRCDVLNNSYNDIKTKLNDIERLNNKYTQRLKKLIFYIISQFILILFILSYNFLHAC